MDWKAWLGEKLQHPGMKAANETLSAGVDAAKGDAARKREVTNSLSGLIKKKKKPGDPGYVAGQ
jgi:hypothetical protein